MGTRQKVLKMTLLASLFVITLTTSCTHKSEKARNDQKMGDARGLMNKGDFAGAAQILATNTTTPQTNNASGALDISFLLSVCQTAMGQKPDFQALSSLQPKERYYILSLLTLLEPAYSLEYLHSRPTLDPQEAAFGITALKMQIQDKAAVQKQVDTWLFPPSDYEKSIHSMKIPSRSEPPSQFHDEVKVLVTRTQALRRELRKEVANRPPQIQMRILEADKTLEQQVGNFIKATPAPANMPAARLTSYKMGLSNIAKDFFNSADEIIKQEALVQQRIGESEQAPLPRPNMGARLKKWPWPPGVLTGEDGFEALSKAISDKNYISAIVLADLLRGGPLKDDGKYYAVRAGLLLMVSSDEAMRSTVLKN